MDRIGLLEDLFNQTRPVLDGTIETAAVDKVELLRVGPLCFKIIDLKVHIGRNP